jgi:hypothetical protein
MHIRKTSLLFTAFVFMMAAHVALAVRDGGDPKADEIIASARKALGGEKTLAAIKSLSLRTEYRREMSAGPLGGAGGTFVMMGGGGGMSVGGSQATGKIEIDVEFPDKYLRSDIGSSGFAMTRNDGFEGSRPFLEIVPNAPGAQVRVDNPADDPERAKAALRRSNRDLARLLLGLVAGTQPGFPVTYSYVAQAEAPDGKADVIEVAGPDDFKARLFIDTQTRLPLMLTYIEAEARPIVRTMTRDGGRGGSGTGGTATGTVVQGAGAGASVAGGGHPQVPSLTPEQREQLDQQIREAEATPPKMVEFRLFFSDYREVDGVSLPHHIVRGTAEKTTEEWDIKSYQVNPKIKPDRFKVGAK